VICKGATAKGSDTVLSIAELAMAERFRWLTATRSTIIQSSPVHTGQTRDAHATLQKIHATLVETE